jgi:hypothetical protein
MIAPSPSPSVATVHRLLLPLRLLTHTQPKTIPLTGSNSTTTASHPQIMRRVIGPGAALLRRALQQQQQEPRRRLPTANGGLRACNGRTRPLMTTTPPPNPTQSAASGSSAGAGAGAGSGGPRPVPPRKGPKVVRVMVWEQARDCSISTTMGWMDQSIDG